MNQNHKKGTGISRGRGWDMVTEKALHEKSRKEWE